MPKTTGDWIGWILFVGVTIGFFSLVFVLVRYLWVRAKPPKKGDDRWLEYLFDEIQKRDAIIKKLELEVAEQKKQRDDLIKQSQEQIKLRKEMGLERETPPPVVEEPPPPLVKLITVVPVTPVLVAVGADSMLKLDIAGFREVRTETGMGFTRILNATLPEIKYRLDLARSKREPFDKLHLSVHAVPEGIELGGVLVDSEALSEVLQGIKIMVLAGCETTHVGAFLGVVPNLVTFSEKISNNDAAFFSKAFWMQIGKRVKPADALRLALEESPGSIEEYIEYHFDN